MIVEWLMNKEAEEDPTGVLPYRDTTLKQFLMALPLILASGLGGSHLINKALKTTKIGASPWIQRNPLVQYPIVLASTVPGVMAAGTMLRHTGQFGPGTSFLMEPTIESPITGYQVPR